MTPLARAYADELDRLRGLGQAFAAAHPHSAGLLGESADDPDVERLLEGVAFVAAGLRGAIDVAASQASRRLLEALMPHWLRPTPAATIVELRPALRTLRSIQRIPAGRELRGPAGDGIAARFTTAADVDLAPLEVVELRAERRSPSEGRITLTLQASDAGAPLVPSLDRLRLFIDHRDPVIAASILAWLRRQHGPGPEVRLLFADPDARLLPWPESVPCGLRVLAEGLAYPGFAGLVELGGLRRLGLQGPRVTIAIDVRAAADGPPLPPLPAQLPPESARLHCAPALGLFPASVEPFEHLPGDRPHLLRVDGPAAGVAGIFDVVEVLVDRRPASRRRCGLLAGPPGRASYAIERGLDGDPERVHLRVDAALDPRARPALVSARVLATNGALAQGLGPGALTLAPGHLLIEAATSVTAVTPSRSPRLLEEPGWRLADHLALARRPLATLDELRAHLRLHVGEAEGGHTRALPGRRAIDAIASMERRRVIRVVGGGPLPVLETTLEIDARALACAAEAELLGDLLDRFLVDQSDAATPSALVIVLRPSGQRMTWPIRQVTRALGRAPEVGR
ncbi:MAG: type VI secretion system baseplate subunit TssF [Myxococcales bacterium]|nr:type VI secretion system baseplate subunit TssF [Myxococcales bacterium]